MCECLTTVVACGSLVVAAVSLYYLIKYVGYTRQISEEAVRQTEASSKPVIIAIPGVVPDAHAKLRNVGKGPALDQSAHPAPEPTFSELKPEDSQRLDQQRAIVARAAQLRYGTSTLTRTRKDLPIFQRFLDDKVFKKSQTYEPQSLGVAFGDVLASEFPLPWVMITDEYGTDPTLHFKNTRININALTMISKRVERDEPVDVPGLLRTTRDALSDEEKRFR